MSRTTLTGRYNAYLGMPLCGDEDQRRSNLMQAIRWLKSEYSHEDMLLLTWPEAVALAKKLLSRALDAEFTKPEVEAFLGK